MPLEPSPLRKCAGRLRFSKARAILLMADVLLFFVVRVIVAALVSIVREPVALADRYSSGCSLDCKWRARSATCFAMRFASRPTPCSIADDIEKRKWRPTK